MAALSTSSSCGSALAAASSPSAASRSSSSSRTLFLGKPLKVVSMSDACEKGRGCNFRNAFYSHAAVCENGAWDVPTPSLIQRSERTDSVMSRRHDLENSIRFVLGSARFTPLSVRATTSTEEATTTSTTTTTIPSASTTETTLQTDELIADLKAKWDGIENKTNVFIYGGGALVALWLSATIVGAVNTVPLLPKVLELVGLGYTGWFVYRYLLFKESRKELAEDIEELKSKITGAGKE